MSASTMLLLPILILLTVGSPWPVHAADLDDVLVETRRSIESAVEIRDFVSAEKLCRLQLGLLKSEDSGQHAYALKQHAAVLRLLSQIPPADIEAHLSSEMMARIAKKLKADSEFGAKRSSEFDAAKSDSKIDAYGPCNYMGSLQRRINHAWLPPREKESLRVQVLFKIDKR